jgi:hypothetical protein
MTEPRYVEGDNYVIDDVTGFKIRASDAVRRWDNAVVHYSQNENRHPQDFVRARVDRQLAKVTRPPVVDFFQGPLMSVVLANVKAGATAMVILDTVRMQAGDTFHTYLRSGDTFRGTIVSVIDSKHLTFSPPLPSAVDGGAKFVNITNLSEGIQP